MLDGDVTPANLPDRHCVDEFLNQGVTTLIGKINLSHSHEVAALEELRAHLPFPIHLGFIERVKPLADQSPQTIAEWVFQTAEITKLLNLSRREPLTIGSRADLIAFGDLEGDQDNQSLRWENLEQVLVAGNIVWKDGKRVADQSGQLLTSHPVR